MKTYKRALFGVKITTEMETPHKLQGFSNQLDYPRGWKFNPLRLQIEAYARWSDVGGARGGNGLSVKRGVGE